MGRMLGAVVAVVVVAGLAWWFMQPPDVVTVPSHEDGVVAPPDDEPTLIGTGEDPDDASDATAAPPKPEGHGRIRGIVVDPRGAPQAGVPIDVSAPAAPQSRTNALGGYSHLSDPSQDTVPAPFARVTSGDDGTFSLDGLDVSKPYYTLTVRPPAPWASTTTSAFAGARPSITRIVLQQGVSTSVQVLDAHDSPTAALVTLELHRPEGRGWRSGPHATDPQGRRRFGRVPTGPLRAEVRIPGHARRTRYVVQPKDGQITLRVAVASGVTVHGTVRGPEGKPIEGARVWVLSGSASHRGPSLERMEATDAKGAYRIEGLLPGAIVAMSCLAEGYVAPQGIYYRRTTVPNDDVQVDFDLQPGAFVHGRVLTTTGKALPNAKVDAGMSVPGGSILFHVSTNSGATGAYELGPLPVGRGGAWAEVDGYVPAERDTPLPMGTHPRAQSPFEISKAGERLEVDLRMQPGTPVGGTIVDGKGAPIAGAKVRIWDRKVQPWSTVSSDGAGVFTFDGLPERDSYHVRMDLGGVRFQTDLDAGTENRVVVPAAASISGRVAWSDGPPKGRWYVVATSASDKRGRRAYPRNDASEFHFEGLTQEAWTLRVDSALRTPATEPVEIDLQAGEQRKDVVLRAETFRSISGIVVDTEGRPKIGHHVAAVATDNAGSAKATTDDQGRFRIDGLPAGEYTVGGDEVSVGATVSAGASDVRLVADVVKSVLRVTVLLPDGTPVSRGTILVEQGENSWYQASIRAGAASHELAEGRSAARVKVAKVWGRAGQLVSVKPYDATISSNEPATIRLEAARSVPGVVVDESGTAVAGVRLVAIDAQVSRPDFNSPNMQILTDAQGRFQLLNVAEGATMRVDVTKPPAGYGRPPTTVVAPDATSIRIVLKRGGMLAGIVVNKDGEPIRNVHVYGRFGNANASGSSGPDGRFALHGVPLGARGDLTASSHMDPYLPATLKDVHEGQKDLRITMRRGHKLRGRVLDPTGKPVSGAPIEVIPEGQRGGTRTSTTTDGTFTISVVAPGRHTVKAAGRGVWLAAEPMEIVVPVDEVVLKLRAGRVVKGRVTGDALAGLSVVWAVPKTKRKIVRLADDGSFAIGVPTADVGALYVTDPKGNRYALLEAVTPPRDGIELSMKAAERITGVVTGVPEGAMTRVSAHGPVFARATVGKDGAFTITGLAPGAYEVSAFWYADGKSGRGKRDAVAAGTRDLVLDLTE